MLIIPDSKKYRRDLAQLQEFEAVNHNMTSAVDYNSETDAATIFAANTSCILAPEVTDGPYYVLGELIRKDVTEGQVGAPLYLEVQYIDIETCEPVQDLYVDIWNCNATGVYSGVESGQGGLNSTFLRGIQATDEDGVVAFETIFPGHYDGRATHTHVLTKSNVTVFDNETTSEGSVTHIGQLFWPEDLITDVEQFEPYNTNTVERTTNDEDMWSIVQSEDDFDPIPQFVYLGDSAEDGLLAWIQIGINSSADHSSDDYYAIAATYYESGGVASSGSSMGGGEGPGGNGTNGTMPSGAMPSGGVPSGTATGLATDSATSTEVASITSSTVVSVSTSSTAAISSSVASGAQQSGQPAQEGQGNNQQKGNDNNQQQGKGGNQQHGQGESPKAHPNAQHKVQQKAQQQGQNY